MTWQKWLVKKWYDDYPTKKVYALDEIWFHDKDVLAKCIELVRKLDEVEL